MKKVKIEDAVNMTLCHDLTMMQGDFKGVAFQRGHVIKEEDIPLLLDIGKKQVYVWEAGEDEIHEEDAAIRLCKMSKPDHAHFEGPSEGKIVLVSDIEGMYRVDTKLLQLVNGIEDVTITTLPDHYPLHAGTKIASMRIIPLVTKEAHIREAEDLCKDRQLMKILPYRDKKAGVIITGSEIYSGRIKDRFEPVVREKLKDYPVTILGVTVCDDDIAMIRQAAETFLEQGADLLIFAGGMSVDPDDVTVEAVESLGAKIVSYGVPAQPGNMSLVAYHQNATILGVPGAAIHLPVTIFDVLLPQVFASEFFTKEDLIRLGEGGLCQRCLTCHYPNCTFGRY
ncbi:MAG: molybdopterin-binding protein [Lachnospiraceae bacterium]|nr:molybdopterin-binding protein [Lachnospiraceae bacterium]